MSSRQLSPLVKAFIARNYPAGSDVQIDDVWYWSTIQFLFTLAGVLAVSSRQAFSYAINGDRSPAGFPAGQPGATMADTNLLENGKTRLNANLFVDGVSAFVMPRTDGALLQRVIEECAVTLSTDGQNTTPLCPLDRIPAAGGLNGAGRSAIKLPPIAGLGVVDGGEGAIINAQTNGMPLAGNLFMFENPILWTGMSGRDSNFRLNFDIGRQINEPVAAARAAAAGVGGYTPPVAVGDVGTFVNLRIYAHALAISKPSVNSGG
jgi:hypothetical protein